MVGIYKITNPNGKIYIGQTIDFERRIKHYKLLKCKEQPRIHRSLIKYGVENHTFELIQECNKNNLTILERFYQELYKSTDKNGLNCILVATDEFSGGHSEESKKKISDRLKGRKANQNAIDAVIKYNKERILTEESRIKLGNGNRGKKQSAEWKDKLSKARKGLKRTDVTKNRISESMSGRKLSEEHRQKLKSRVITDEWRLKLSIAAKNRKSKNN
jgi:group I intron endonuclease